MRRVNKRRRYVLTRLLKPASHEFYFYEFCDSPEKREVKRRLDDENWEFGATLRRFRSWRCYSFQNVFATRTAPWRRQAYYQQSKPVWWDLNERLGSQILIFRHCWYQKLFFIFQSLKNTSRGHCWCSDMIYDWSSQLYTQLKQLWN